MFLVEPEVATLHGTFSREFEPVTTVDSGDTVRFRTLDVSWGMEPPVDEVSPRRKFEPREGERNSGPALCGPVAVRGAEPGMTMEIRIQDVRPASWGFTWIGGSDFFNTELNRALGVADEPLRLMTWDLDPDAMLGTNQHGHQVKLRPFPGTLGMPPCLPGLHSGWFPRATGGNMDCKELTAGSILYLPIEVPGGLVSVGDGHAAQGDGEVAGTAIECMLERIDLQLVVREDFPIATPHVRTPSGWLTLGFGEDLDQASATALNAMLDLISRLYQLKRVDALGLASIIVDMRMTQLVNGVRGVHAYLPHDALSKV